MSTTEPQNNKYYNEWMISSHSITNDNKQTKVETKLKFKKTNQCSLAFFYHLIKLNESFF